MGAAEPYCHSNAVLERPLSQNRLRAGIRQSPVTSAPDLSTSTHRRRTLYSQNPVRKPQVSLVRRIYFSAQAYAPNTSAPSRPMPLYPVEWEPLQPEGPWVQSLADDNLDFYHRLRPSTMPCYPAKSAKLRCLSAVSCPHCRGRLFALRRK